MSGDGHTNETRKLDLDARMGGDRPTVCIAHGRFVPCRRDGEHRESHNPFWVKSVVDFQTSTIEGLTWEPAWERASR